MVLRISVNRDEIEIQRFLSLSGSSLVGTFWFFPGWEGCQLI